MTIYITQGRYTQSAMKGLVQNPEDRSKAVQALIEAAGGKMLHYFVTFGEFDFMVISEAANERDVAKVLLAAAASGGVEGVKTAPALTAEEAVEAFTGAGHLARGFRAAGA